MNGNTRVHDKQVALCNELRIVLAMRTMYYPRTTGSDCNPPLRLPPSENPRLQLNCLNSLFTPRYITRELQCSYRKKAGGSYPLVVLTLCNPREHCRGAFAQCICCAASVLWDGSRNSLTYTCIPSLKRPYHLGNWKGRNASRVESIASMKWKSRQALCTQHLPLQSTVDPPKADQFQK